MNPYRFAIVGAGWRTEFFLRIAAAIPERFRLEGLVVRDAAKGQRLTKQWGHATYRTVPELFTRQPHHAARLAAVWQGRIGAAHKAYVSVCHGYHGASLIRHFLGVGFA